MNSKPGDTGSLKRRKNRGRGRGHWQQPKQTTALRPGCSENPAEPEKTTAPLGSNAGADGGKGGEVCSLMQRDHHKPSAPKATAAKKEDVAVTNIAGSSEMNTVETIPINSPVNIAAAVPQVVGELSEDLNTGIAGGLKKDIVGTSSGELKDTTPKLDSVKRGDTPVKITASMDVNVENCVPANSVGQIADQKKAVDMPLLHNTVIQSATCLKSKLERIPEMQAARAKAAVFENKTQSYETIDSNPVKVTAAVSQDKGEPVEELKHGIAGGFYQKSALEKIKPFVEDNNTSAHPINTMNKTVNIIEEKDFDSISTNDVKDPIKKDATDNCTVFVVTETTITKETKDNDITINANNENVTKENKHVIAKETPGDTIVKVIGGAVNRNTDGSMMKLIDPNPSINTEQATSQKNIKEGAPKKSIVGKKTALNVRDQIVQGLHQDKLLQKRFDSNADQMQRDSVENVAYKKGDILLFAIEHTENTLNKTNDVYAAKSGSVTGTTADACQSKADTLNPNYKEDQGDIEKGKGGSVETEIGTVKDDTVTKYAPVEMDKDKEKMLQENVAYKKEDILLSAIEHIENTVKKIDDVYVAPSGSVTSTTEDVCQSKSDTLNPTYKEDQGDTEKGKGASVETEIETVKDDIVTKPAPVEMDKDKAIMLQEIITSVNKEQSSPETLLLEIINQMSADNEKKRKLWDALPLILKIWQILKTD